MLGPVSLGVKRPMCEANQLLPSSTGIKNGWSYTSIPSCVLLHVAYLYFLHALICQVIKTEPIPWLRGIRRGSAPASLLGLRVGIQPGTWVSVVSDVCFQVDVSASGWSLVQSPTYCGVSESDLETSTMRRPGPTRAVEPWMWEGNRDTSFQVFTTGSFAA